MILKQRHPKNIKRYREIAAILARHGLGWLAIELNLGALIPFHRGLLKHPRREEPYTQAEHIRMALEDFGTTFIKLGQILSTRPDIIPSDYVAQFSRLQDSVPPMPFAQVTGVIIRELGQSPEKIFKAFDAEPLASASIGQVHAARLNDDTPVVVKVQRPGVGYLIERDLEVLRDVAVFAEHHTAWGASYDIQGWLEEFAFTLQNELDYTREGQNADRIRRNFAGDERLRVPQIYWDYTSARVIAMQEISGIKITDIKSLDAAGLDRRRIAENCAHIALTMTYDHGFFHADPHPGNFFVLENEVIGLIDYGLVGRLDESLRDALLRVCMALIRKDAERLADELIELGIVKGSVRRNILKRDLDHFIQRFYDKPLKEVAASQAFKELTAVSLRHRLQLPGDLIVLFKVIAMSEGLGSQLDPEFRMMEFAEPYFRRFWVQSRSIRRQVRRIVEGSQELAELGFSMPKHARRFLGRLERGELTMITHHEGLEDAVKELQRASNRVSVSILTAALIIGLGLLMLVYHPPGWEEYGGWFFGLLFMVIVFFGLGLLWKIWRSGRER